MTPDDATSAWLAVLARLKTQGVKFVAEAGPERLVGRRGSDLVVLTADGNTELWHYPVPGPEEGVVAAGEHAILWSKNRKGGGLVAMAAADGRQLYTLAGESAVVIAGDRFLATNSDGTHSLRRAETGE